MPDESLPPPGLHSGGQVLANAGDVALVSSTWVLEGTGPDGKPVRCGVTVPGRHRLAIAFLIALSADSAGTDPGHPGQASR